jgi:hypothetical protein
MRDKFFRRKVWRETNFTPSAQFQGAWNQVRPDRGAIQVSCSGVHLPSKSLRRVTNLPMEDLAALGERQSSFSFAEAAFDDGFGAIRDT